MPLRTQRNVQEYYKAIRGCKRECNAKGMTDDDFREIYDEALQDNNDLPQVNQYFTRRRINLLLAFNVLLIILNYKSMYSCIACNVQDYIYPGLRLLRKMFIPLISLFPSLTGLYHETCLIQNPFFAVADMDCWPCSAVNNIMEVPKPEPVNEQHNAPFFYKTEQELVTIERLQQFYMKNQHLFDTESPKVLTDDKVYSPPTEMFSQLNSGDQHAYIWKFNNMNLAKTLRLIIPRPAVVPKFGQSTERYLVIDTSQEQFRIPDTECNFSFLLSLSGSRTIELRPAEECKHQCKSLKVELDETYLLWYNWWYWRPIVQPTTGNATYIAHVGSYC